MSKRARSGKPLTPMPFKNLFNELCIRDTSRKIRAVQRAKAQHGERLGTRAPYGYRKDEQDRKRLVVDEEAAAVVRRWAGPQPDRPTAEAGAGTVPHDLRLQNLWRCP